MKILQNRVIAGLLPLLLSACVDMPSHAPIDDRTARYQQKSTDQDKQAAAVPDAPGFYTVKKGDTLRKIAQQFNQSVRDLTDWNSLSNPNDIKIGQSLRIAQPEGAQLASVPVDTGLEIKPLDSRPTTAPNPPTSSTALMKSNPLGSKVAYTDQAWADMQRGDSAPVRSLESPRKADSAAFGKFMWPTEGRIVSSFDPTRKGIDIAGQAGQPIVAASDGTVLYAKNMRGYGNLVIVDHNDGLVSAYAHNKTILVKEGQIVSRGQRIAEMGDSDADTVKLHFEIRQLGKPVDPVGLLPSR